VTYPHTPGPPPPPSCRQLQSQRHWRHPLGTATPRRTAPGSQAQALVERADLAVAGRTRPGYLPLCKDRPAPSAQARAQAWAWAWGQPRVCVRSRERPGTFRVQRPSHHQKNSKDLGKLKGQGNTQCGETDPSAGTGWVPGPREPPSPHQGPLAGVCEGKGAHSSPAPAPAPSHHTPSPLLPCPHQWPGFPAQHGRRGRARVPSTATGAGHLVPAETRWVGGHHRHCRHRHCRHRHRHPQAQEFPSQSLGVQWCRAGPVQGPAVPQHQPQTRTRVV
jgi:hypothetical protein